MAEKFVEATVDSSQLRLLQEALERKPKEDAKRIVRDALELGSIEFHKAIVAEAPKRTGFLSSHFNIKFSFRGSTDGTKGAAFIGPNGRMDYPLSGGGYKKKKGSRKVGRMNKIPRTYGPTEIGQTPRTIAPQGTIPRCPHGNYAPKGDNSSCFLCNPIRPKEDFVPLSKTEVA